MEVSRERGEGNKGSVGDGDVPLGGLATLGEGGGRRTLVRVSARRRVVTNSGAGLSR